MDKKLEVKNLKISFKTANGKVQAVRNINFDLYKGETLAIVGESGSGKSVTSKSMLGILAGNAIIESGEIIYDGKDLLKISEDEFYRIRGDKIAMIFQDPMSSLNPIMRIGKQLTEAMILKGKARQRASRKEFNTKLKLLEDTMILASKGKNRAYAKNACRRFNDFEVVHVQLEHSYNSALEAVNEIIPIIDEMLFLIEKNVRANYAQKLGKISTYLPSVNNNYMINSAEYEKLVVKSKALNAAIKRESGKGEFAQTVQILNEMKDILVVARDRQHPNFFRLAYYLKFSGKPVPTLPVAELDAFLLEYLDKNFMLQFIETSEEALKYHAELKAGEKRTALNYAVKFADEIRSTTKLQRSAVAQKAKVLRQLVQKSIDTFEVNKDSIAYTFGTSIDYAINNYFEAIERNNTALKKFNEQTKKYNALVARHKKPDWKVAPVALIDLDDAKNDILNVIERLSGHYSNLLSKMATRDYAKETVALIDFFMQNAADSGYKVTKATAKRKAIKLMEEVGIPEPEKRFRQYPFEFSGGMRQRIVIAVALAANPDILICDEPTTALDVTIQAQILELINQIKRERQLSIIFITHDLGVVANMADRIAVMYAGKIVEYGTSEDIFYRPAHPYTWALLSSMPDLDTNERLDAIPGTPPNMIYPPVGDAFADRNKYALEIDFELQPPMFQISDTHYAATWLLHENAPKVDPPKIVTDRIERMKMRGGNQ